MKDGISCLEVVFIYHEDHHATHGPDLVGPISCCI